MRLIAAVIVVGIFLILLWTSYYTVAAESEGVVLRFGKFLKTVEPGLHFKLPLGIDEVTFHKRTPLVTDRPKVLNLMKRGAHLAVDEAARAARVEVVEVAWLPVVRAASGHRPRRLVGVHRRARVLAALRLRPGHARGTFSRRAAR